MHDTVYIWICKHYCNVFWFNSQFVISYPLKLKHASVSIIIKIKKSKKREIIIPKAAEKQHNTSIV